MRFTWLQKKLNSAKNGLVIQHLDTAVHNCKIEKEPFQHIVIDNAFPEKFNKEISLEFEKVKSRGLSNVPLDPKRFSTLGKYDAFSWALPPDERNPLFFFYSKELRDYFANLFQIECTNDVSAGMHHHEIQSKSGWVHNDYTAVSFKNKVTDEMNPWYMDCPHQTDVPLPGAHIGVRAIAILYYFTDKVWQEGDGGETGLYLNENTSSLIKKVAPINNRLLAFEVNPKSFHAFLSNLKYERNSIVMWFHQKPSLSIERFKMPYSKWKRKPVILLTGATGKLGSLFTRMYSPYYDIIGVARKKPDSTEGYCDFIAGDITTDYKKIISEILSRHNKIDVLINNAYIHIPEPLLEKDNETMKLEFETNLFAPINLIKEIFTTFWKTEGKEKNTANRRCIVNISSGASKDFIFDARNLGVYSATKASLNMVTKQLSAELGQHGIRVNAVTPGFFENEEYIRLVSKNIALQIEGTMNGEVTNLKED